MKTERTTNKKEGRNQTQTPVFTARDLAELKRKAERSGRLRAIETLHEGPWEHAHVYLNEINKESYIRPHVHRDRYKSEHYLLLEGKAATVFFKTNGEIEGVMYVEGIINAAYDRRYPDNLYVKVEPGRWHTFVALEDCTLYVTKGQPDEGYDQETDKVIAPWAPEEGTPEAIEYFEDLRREILEYVKEAL